MDELVQLALNQFIHSTVGIPETRFVFGYIIRSATTLPTIFAIEIAF